MTLIVLTGPLNSNPVNQQYPMILEADSEGLDQTARMRRLV